MNIKTLFAATLALGAFESAHARKIDLLCSQGQHRSGAAFRDSYSQGGDSDGLLFVAIHTGYATAGSLAPFIESLGHAKNYESLHLSVPNGWSSCNVSDTGLPLRVTCTLENLESPLEVWGSDFNSRWERAFRVSRAVVTVSRTATGTDLSYDLTDADTGRNAQATYSFTRCMGWE